MKKSIKHKLTFFVFLIILAIMILQNIFGHFGAEPYFMAQKEKKMLELFTVLNEENSATDLAVIAEAYEDKENIRIVVLDSQDHALYSSNGTGLIYLQMNKYIFSSPPTIIEIVNQKTARKSLMLFGIGEDGKKFIFDTSISAIQTTSKLLMDFNIIIVLFVLFPSLFAVYLFSRRFVQPIEEICDVTKALAALDFSKKACEYKQKDEIHLLFENINSMAEQLEYTIESLKAANLSLQKDVDHQKQIDNMRKQFIADVSHELKSPLALITMYCENLKSDDPLVDRAFYCDATIDECLRLGELVKNLLEISSLENHLTKLSCETVNFSDYILWLLAKHKVLFDQRNLRYHQEIQPDIYAEIDKFYMEQAIKNLLFNAAEYSTGQVSVKLYVQADELCFSIYNTCNILSDEYLKLIWNCFYRMDTARTQGEVVHTGLGLHIVKTIISAHNGKSETERKDGGLEFFIKLKTL